MDGRDGARCQRSAIQPLVSAQGHRPALAPPASGRPVEDTGGPCAAGNAGACIVRPLVEKPVPVAASSADAADTAIGRVPTEVMNIAGVGAPHSVPERAGLRHRQRIRTKSPGRYR